MQKTLLFCCSLSATIFSWWLVAKLPVWCSCTIFWKPCRWRGTPDTWTHLAALNTRQSSRSRQKETTQKYWKSEDPKCSELYHPGSWAATFLRRKGFLQTVRWRADHRYIKHLPETNWHCSATCRTKSREGREAATRFPLLWVQEGEDERACFEYLRKKSFNAHYAHEVKFYPAK